MHKGLIALLLTAPAVFAADFPAWMAGSWRSGAVEEHWTAPAGGLMVGMTREVRPNRKARFEFLRIEEKDGKLVYVAMPGGRPPTLFPLESQTASRVVFENLEHDFPQRVIYWRDGEGLCARVEGTIKGKLEAEQWCWQRIIDSPSPSPPR